MLTRRQFLIASAALIGTSGCARWMTDSRKTVVNDVHSQTNPTQVFKIVTPKSIEDIRKIIVEARHERRAVSITGGRHAMGGQQFGADTILMDMKAMNRVVHFDSEKGLIEVEAGIQWPELIEHLTSVQQGRWPQWGIIQKQTGADRLSLGGALSANIHGRGLQLKPIIGDVESFSLVDAAGDVRNCSRQENQELFRLVIGGYGLFGVIATVTLRLSPRTKLERVVELIELKDLMTGFEKRITEHFLYGDFQYMTDRSSDDFLRKGIFSCYRPVVAGTPIPEGQRELSSGDWNELYYLAHTNRRRVITWHPRDRSTGRTPTN
jgi:FAD/FMN-containing dehydrogenase